MSRKFKDFTVKVGGQDKKFKVYMPRKREDQESKKVRTVVFNEYLKAGAPLKKEVNVLLKERGVWSQEDIDKLESTMIKISDKLKTLEGGNMKLSEGRAIAVEVGHMRRDIRELVVIMSEASNDTAEGQADNAAFDSLIASCTFCVEKDRETKHYASLDAYLDSEEDEVDDGAARALLDLMYGDRIVSSQKDMPENVFLREYGFVDDELRYINKEGGFIDENGKSIDEDGFYINEDGEHVDVDGDLIVITKKQPFLDEKGKPIVTETTKVESKE